VHHRIGDGDRIKTFVCFPIFWLRMITHLAPVDPESTSSSSVDKMEKLRNQKERQEKVLVLVREATALVERTRLNVR
jgi:hypothetical protein